MRTLDRNAARADVSGGSAAPVPGANGGVVPSFIPGLDYAGCSNNPASLRVLEKAGLIREAVHGRAITKNETLLDEMMYVPATILIPVCPGNEMGGFSRNATPYIGPGYVQMR